MVEVSIHGENGLSGWQRKLKMNNLEKTQSRSENKPANLKKMKEEEEK